MTKEIRIRPALQSMIENLAGRAAEENGGRITAHHLLPYVPASLRIIETCLDRMTDWVDVYETRDNEIKAYGFKIIALF